MAVLLVDAYAPNGKEQQVSVGVPKTAVAVASTTALSSFPPYLPFARSASVWLPPYVRVLQ